MDCYTGKYTWDPSLSNMAIDVIEKKWETKISVGDFERNGASLLSREMNACVVR